MVLYLNIQSYNHLAFCPICNLFKSKPELRIMELSRISPRHLEQTIPYYIGFVSFFHSAMFPTAQVSVCDEISTCGHFQGY